MTPTSKSLLLFSLNWLDAQLTLAWVRGGFATEGNGLMAYLLDIGDAPFLLTKLFVGATVAYVLYHWSHLTVARRGMKLVLGLYLALMLVHAATGLSALGLAAPEQFFALLGSIPDSLLAFLF